MRSLRDDLLAEIGEIIDSSSFVNGRQVAAFEEQFASAVGVAHCVGARERARRAPPRA